MVSNLAEKAERVRRESDERALAHLVRYPHLQVTGYQLGRKLGGHARQYVASLERLRERGLVDRVAESSPGVAAIYRLAARPLDVSKEALGWPGRP